MSRSPDHLDAPEGAKLRILVVDDEPTLRLGFAYALASPTAAVDTASTGRHALEKIGSTRFDIIILDLRMPDLDGSGVIDALRARGNRIPVILCSAALTPDAALRAIRHGVVDFLLKPVSPLDLRQMVEFVLHPDSGPFALAMKAARDGMTDRAIEILRQQENSGQRAECWLSVLNSIRNSAVAANPFELEEMLRTSLSVLAFNTQPD